MVKLIKDKEQEILSLNKKLKLPEAKNVKILEISTLEEEKIKLQSELRENKLFMESWKKEEIELKVQVSTLHKENTLGAKKHEVAQAQ